jgi:L-ascorbate metabolism protein UlaG (beta-lactamase superfamily)
VAHWGARLGSDTYRGYTGFIVEREGQKLLIGGDTAGTRAFSAHRRYGPFAAAVMPIGAYDPGFARIARPSRPLRWPTPPEGGCSCRSTTSRSS